MQIMWVLPIFGLIRIEHITIELVTNSWVLSIDELYCGPNFSCHRVFNYSITVFTELRVIDAEVQSYALSLQAQLKIVYCHRQGMLICIFKHFLQLAGSSLNPACSIMNKENDSTRKQCSEKYRLNSLKNKM
jgi:hypothetical protein